jgi:hypothetical protein
VPDIAAVGNGLLLGFAGRRLGKGDGAGLLHFARNCAVRGKALGCFASLAMTFATFSRHCEERSDAATHASDEGAGLLRFARNDGWRFERHITQKNGPPGEGRPSEAFKPVREESVPATGTMIPLPELG